MNSELSADQVATVTVLLQAGKTIKEISKFADLDRAAVTTIAHDLDIEPPNEAQRRAKALFGSPDGLTYQEVAERLRSEGLANDDGKPVHYLTVSTWVANYGWRWGGAEHGDYAPIRATAGPTRSKYTLRLSKKLASTLNAPASIEAAAATAWEELSTDRTHVVSLAIIRGAAQAGVTDLVAVKKALFAARGDEIRTARA